MAPAKKGAKTTGPRNSELIPGLMRFSRARMFHKRGVWAIKKKTKVAAKPKSDSELTVVKKIGGDQNGKERTVLKVKAPKRLSEARCPERKPKRKTKYNQCKIRASITPGTVLVLLAGRHKGKRVVYLSSLPKSGCLLVTGPLKVNNCPLRRIPQAYVMATKTKLDISAVKVPEHINDDYFKRAKKMKKSKKDDTELFTSNKEEYVVSDQRKTDQQTVDKQLIATIKKRSDKKMMFGYLGSFFSLRKGQTPHSMVI
jgi:large subunit ribosomal protein L6e